MIKRFLFLFAFISIISGVYSATTISSLPYTISTPGEYDLSGNLNTSTDGIIITTQNVSINCLGYTITQNNSRDYGDNGIDVNSDSYDYINVSNCGFINFYYTLNMNLGDYFIFNNISISNSTTAVYIQGSTYNSLNNLTIYNSSSQGFWLQYSSYNNLSNIIVLNSNNSWATIYDNTPYFNFTNITFDKGILMNSGLFQGFTFNNVSDGNGHYVIASSNTPLVIDGWTNVSMIYLDNADNSIIRNITFPTGNGYNTYIYMINNDNSNFSYLNYTNGYSAVILRTSSNNRFSNIYAYSNVYAAFDFVSISANNYFDNSTLFNNTYDLTSYTYAILTNITDNLGKYVVQCVNTPLNINGWTNISRIVMSNCDNSNIQNLNSVGQFRKDYFIYSINTDFSNFTNLNITNYSYGIVISTNLNNLLSNLRIYNNTGYGMSIGHLSNSILTNITIYSNWIGMHLAFGGNNTIDNLTSYYNGDKGFSIGSCNYNRFSNFNVYNNTGQGIDVQGQYNLFTNFTASYNNWGFSAGSNNNYSNFSTRYNSIGVYFFGGSNSRFNDFTSYNNTHYGIYVYFNSDSNSFTNFTLINNSDGIRLETSSNYNSFSNFNTSYNTQQGIILADSSTNNNNFSNFNSFKNTQRGIYIVSAYNSFNNFTTYNNTQQGIYVVSGKNNTFNNFSSYYNSASGIQLQDSNNTISNFMIYNQTTYGIYLYSNSDTNYFFNGTSINNSVYNVRLEQQSSTNAPNDNVFYNNYLGNVSKFYSNNWSNVNYFNSSLSGYNIGNYWNDFGVCSVKTMVGPYGVCANPANYTINSTNNIYDFAPLYNPYEIDSCTNLSIAGGNYYMTASILNSATSNCINISANNITFDCRGFTIDGDDATQRGIYLYRSSVQTTNVTIKNCIVSDWSGYNMFIFRSNLNVLQNLTINSSAGYGINLDGSDNVLSNITINNNNQHGLFLSAAARNNLSGINILNNGQVGLYVQGSENNSIYNSTINNNTQGDFYLYASSNSYCNNLVSNVTDSSGKFHIYSNQSVNIDSWTNLSSIMLCNADNSIVKNLNYNSSNNLKGKFIYLMRTDSSNLSNLNIGKYYNGIGLESSSNNNLYNFTSFNNVDDGLYLTSSNSNNISNFSNYGNSQMGVSVWSSSNNQFSNFNVYLNVQAGIEIYAGTGSFFSNFNNYNNTGKGIYLWSGANNNMFSNFTNYYNGQEGVHLGLGGGAKNNTFYNATLTPNTGHNVYFQYTAANYPVNNTFYNSFLGNSSKIYSNFAYNNTIGYNYFNSSLSGYNIGNYWNDFGVCSSYQTSGSYKVCLNPANYTINAGNNTYDLAPLIIAPEYISPTPANNSNLGTNTLTIKVEDTQRVSTWFNVTINGVSYAMINTSSTTYEYTLSDGFNEITEVTFNVSYAGSGIMETRTFTYYPDYTNTVFSSYGFASFFISIISILFLFFNLNFRKNKSKKGITEVIAIISLLLVAVTAAIFVNSWYQDFTVSYQTKKLGSSATSANSFEVVAIENESSSLFVYLKSKSAGYSIIERISVNSVDCTIVQDNVILGSSITPIEIECSSVDTVNNYIVVYSKKAIFSANVPLIN